MRKKRKKALKKLGYSLLFWSALWALVLGWPNPTDQGFFTRSGLDLKVDYGTGCHWLQGWFSPPVPRLDGEGNHVGCRTQEGG